MAIGILAAALVLFLVDRVRTQMAIEEVTRFLQGLTRGMEASSARSAEEIRRREAERAASEQARRMEQAAQQRRIDDARRGAREEAARKEQAWAKFYKRPPHCDNDVNQERLVECANHHIRAKRQFEEAYSAGRL